jgi:hypothetical protein
MAAPPTAREAGAGVRPAVAEYLHCGRVQELSEVAGLPAGPETAVLGR